MKRSAIADAKEKLEFERSSGISTASCDEAYWTNWCRTRPQFLQDWRWCVSQNMAQCQANNQSMYQATKPEHDQRMRDLTNKVYAAQAYPSGEEPAAGFRFCRADVSPYEGNYIIYVRVRELGSPRFYEVKMEMNSAGRQWRGKVLEDNGPFEDSPSQRWCYNTVN